MLDDPPNTARGKEIPEVKIIIGTDEAGRGPLAGPVVAGAVALCSDFHDEKIKDSKQLSAKQRDYLSQQIRAIALAWSVVAVGHRRIEELNILGASKHAMRLAVERTMRALRPNYPAACVTVLVDGNALIPLPEWLRSVEQKAIVGGDRSVVHISAASILAKTHRDHLMEELAQRYPGYGFERHAGYPTPSHRQAIQALGPSKVHRLSFRGVREYVGARAGSEPVPHLAASESHSISR